MKLISAILILTYSLHCFSQASNTPVIEDALHAFQFIEGKVTDHGDTIAYFLKKYKEKPQNLVVFIQGSDANPVFTYEIKNGKTNFYRWFADDYKLLDSTYAFAIVPKPGMDGLYIEHNWSVPEEYYRKNYLDYRVKQIDLSIDDIIKNHLQNPKDIIVYGHSEGAAIAAAVATKNKHITHLGFWSGNVLNNFYEFALFDRIEALQGHQTDSAANQNIMNIINWYKEVIREPNSTAVDKFGVTNKRWASYETPPIDYLLRVDIPIFAQFATEDESTPIETAYLLPIRFLEYQKDNLTFNVCVNCDHSYKEKKGEDVINHWPEIFRKFIEWTKNN